MALLAVARVVVAGLESSIPVATTEVFLVLRTNESADCHVSGLHCLLVVRVGVSGGCMLFAVADLEVEHLLEPVCRASAAICSKALGGHGG